MNPNQYALDVIIGQIWMAIHGGGIDYIQVFTDAGGSIWGIMMTIAIWQEAVNIASGRETELPKTLILYMCLGLLIWQWPFIADHLYQGSIASMNAFIHKDSTFLGNVAYAYQKMQELDIASSTQQGGMSLDPFTSAVISGLSVIIGFLALIACYLLAIVTIAGSFCILALYLAMGPLFIAFALSEHFRSLTFHWFGAVLSYLIIIPLYGAALDIVNVIFGASMPNWNTMMGTPSIDHIFIMLFGPVISIGLILSVSRVAHELTGGIGSTAGSMVASIGAVGAAMAAKMGGSAMTGGASSAAGAGASAAGGAVSSAGSGAIRAATQG